MSSQDYSIGFTSRQGVLRAHVVGSASIENTIGYWTDIVAQAKAQRPHALLLIDELIGPPLSAEEWFGLVQAMLGQGLEPLRIAHVKPHGLERIEYCEIYAKEAGFDARVFEDAASAELWLRHGERENTGDAAVAVRRHNRPDSNESGRSGGRRRFTDRT